MRVKRLLCSIAVINLTVGAAMAAAPVGASGFSGGFSVEDSVIAFEVHGPTKQLDEVYED